MKHGQKNIKQCVSLKDLCRICPNLWFWSSV